jgi:hypothetical protein
MMKTEICNVTVRVSDYVVSAAEIVEGRKVRRTFSAFDKRISKVTLADANNPPTFARKDGGIYCS